MSKFALVIFFALLLSANAFGHQAFTLVSIEKKNLRTEDISRAEREQSIGKLEGSNIRYDVREVRLIALTGPQEDALSYKIQGVRNPNLVVPAGATLKILFVNADMDMRHDIRFGHITGEFQVVPNIPETAGSSKLMAKTADGTFQAEELVIKANDQGAFKYFCSVRGHARDGMWGNIFVGVKPGANVKMAEKTEHVHSDDEDHAAHDHAAPEPAASPSPAKRGEHTDHSPKPTPSPAAATIDEHRGHKPAPAKEAGHQHGGEASPHANGYSPHQAGSSINIGEPMSREGSGTSWIPDASPMYAWMKMFSDGSHLMVHGTMFLRYTSIGSDRDVSAAGRGGRSRLDVPSMFMAMYAKPIGERSQIGLRTMFSLDPLVERGWGYPLLYQSGELYRGQPLHDRQHPHDLISELAASFSHKVGEKSSFFVYAGLPGEPALGPPMYLHRPSGMNNPDAPIGHHWQDATHITYGVVTGGFTYDRFKVEASVFNGTEPDENRWAFDRPKLDSFSGRVSFNPTREWSFQISHGYLKDPERSEPDLKVLRRTTASAIFNKAFGTDRNWSNTVVWGQNRSDEGVSNSFLIETNYEFGRNAVFGRGEQVQKDGHELALPDPHPHGNFWVQAYSIGYVRDIVKDKGVDIGIGGIGTFNFNPSEISGFYGGTRHAGWQIFLRFRPSQRR
jgi:hypothetical protein